MKVTKFDQLVKILLREDTGASPSADRQKRLEELSTRKNNARMASLPEDNVHKKSFEVLKKQARARGEELDATPLTPEEETELQTLLQQKDHFETRPRPSNATGSSREYDEEKFRSMERNI